MPLVKSDYKAPHLFKNGHFSTIYSGLIRQVTGVQLQRERLSLSDGDFLDLDWSYSTKPSDSLVILLHGLEGNAQRPYILGCAKQFNKNGLDTVGVNFRGCSGKPNTKYRSYHSGATEDLEDIIKHILGLKNYRAIFIKGFSLGGNMTLKYLGENANVPIEIKAAMAVSVPCDLSGSCTELHAFKNILYHDRFKKHLVDRLIYKQKQFPERISVAEIRSIKSLKDFDDVYTSKAHGFKDAEDYYKQCSSLQFLHNISIPTLILNARNDSFLSDSCYPNKQAQQNPNLFLEISDHGGHVGFFQGTNRFYNEGRGLEFFNETMPTYLRS